MQRQHARLIEALERVEGFLEENGELMAGVITSKAHENFSASRQRMVEHMTAQEQYTRGIRSGVAVKGRLADLLVRKHMRPIAIISRKQLPHVGEFSALKLPRQRRQLSTLAAAAYGMARAAKVHEATFLEAGLPADFVDQLVAATDALKEAITDKGRAEGARVKATRGGPEGGARGAVQPQPDRCPRALDGSRPTTSWSTSGARSVGWRRWRSRPALSRIRSSRRRCRGSRGAARPRRLPVRRFRRRFSRRRTRRRRRNDSDRKERRLDSAAERRSTEGCAGGRARPTRPSAYSSLH